MRHSVFIRRRIALLLFCLPALLRAQQKTLDADALAHLSLEDLFSVKITTASHFEEHIDEIPASVVLITREEIALYGYRSLQEILESVPGIYVIDQYAHTDVTLGMRGFWSSSTKGVIIMVNGVSQLQDVYAHYPLNRVGVPVEAIDRIEIIRGPMSVIYGSGAFYGAINIITNQADEPESRLSASYGAEHDHRLFMRHSGRGENFAFTLNAGLQAADGQTVPWNTLSDNIYFAQGETDHFFETGSYYFQLSSEYNGFYGDVSVRRDNRTWIFLSIDRNNPNRKLSDFADVQMGYKYTGSDGEVDMHVGYSSTNIQSGNTFPHDAADRYLDYSHWALGSQAIHADVSGVRHFSPAFDLTGGLLYRRLLQRYELLNMPAIPYNDVAIYQPNDVNLASGALFLQADYKWSEKLKAVAGLRLEKNGRGLNIWELGYGHDPTDTEQPYMLWEIPMDATPVQFIPRLALIYSPHQNHLFKLMFGRAVRMPAYHENNDVRESGMVSLEPERIHTLELNYLMAFSERVNLGLSLYKNTLDNLIYRREWLEDGIYLTRQTNEGRMNTSGLEVNLRFKPGQRLSGSLSLAYQDTEDERNPDREVMASPQWLAYGKMSVRLSSSLTAALTGHYVGEMVSQWDTARLNEDGSYGGRMGDDAPAYLNMGLNLRLENCLKKKIDVNLRISNLLDQEIRYPVYSHSRWAEKGTLGIGRLWLLTLGKRF